MIDSPYFFARVPPTPSISRSSAFETGTELAIAAMPDVGTIWYGMTPRLSQTLARQSLSNWASASTWLSGILLTHSSSQVTQPDNTQVNDSTYRLDDLLSGISGNAVGLDGGATT
jgi:hypothetical protein